MVMLGEEEYVGPNIVGSRPKACGNSKGVGNGAWGAPGSGGGLGKSRTGPVLGLPGPAPVPLGHLILRLMTTSDRAGMAILK